VTGEQPNLRGPKSPRTKIRPVSVGGIGGPTYSVEKISEARTNLTFIHPNIMVCLGAREE